jgi:hypothetical protein
MPKDLGDIIIGSIFRHTVLGLLTGGVGNIIAAVGDVMDFMDASDAIDASQAVSSVSLLPLTLSSDIINLKFTDYRGIGRTDTLRNGPF